MRVHGYSEQNHASSPLFCPLPSRPLRPGPARPTAPRPWPVVGAVARSRGAPPPPAAGAERERVEREREEAAEGATDQKGSILQRETENSLPTA